MKFNIYPSGVFFLLLFSMFLTQTGCGRSSRARNMLKDTRERYTYVFNDCTEAKHKEFDEAARALKEIADKYPELDISAEIQFSLGRMYAMRKEYGKARENFSNVFMNYPQYQELCARALFLSGIVSQEEGEWKKALEYFDEITARYPLTYTGLNTQLYIADYYRKKDMTEESQRAYRQAVGEFMDMITDNPFDEKAPVVQSYLISAYAALGTWDEAAKTLENLAEEFPDSSLAPSALYHAAIIYKDRLNQDDMATGTLCRLKNRYPGTSLLMAERFYKANASARKHLPETMFDKQF